MKLLADSGGSKTTWSIISNGKINSLTTKGMNPYYNSQASLNLILESELLPSISVNDISEIYFYGAGCSSDQSCEKVSNSLHSKLPKAVIHVNHDLLGAARALCQNEAGLVGILGTGSNSCFYNGTTIASHVPSLGYILGDEGGGGHMGKVLLRDFIRNKLPENIHQKIEALGCTKANIENRIYLEKNPISFLSGFAPLIKENIELDYFKELVMQTFDAFIDNCLVAYENHQAYPIHFSGSIAYYFKDQLNNALNKHNLQLGSVVKNPIEGLTKFHSTLN